MDIKDIEHLAEVSKIELTEAEKAKLPKDLESVLAYIKQVEMFELPDVVPEHTHVNIWREDELLEREFSYDLIIEQFPDKQDNFVKVKKIL